MKLVRTKGFTQKPKKKIGKISNMFNGCFIGVSRLLSIM